MTFKAKRDRFFIITISVTLLIIIAVTIGPIVYILFFEQETNWTAIIILFTTMISTSGFILWVCIDIEYTMYNNFLLVRGGIFRSKIPYDEITKINESSNIFVGYRILSSKDALEIHYKQALLGSVIISPKQKQLFIEELQKRCPLL